MYRKSILAILFAIVLVLGTMPVEAWAAHTIILEDGDGAPVAEVNVQIAVYCEGGWQTVSGYTDDEGVFTNDTFVPAIGQSCWQAVLLDPGWNFVGENNPCLINYPQTVKVIEVVPVR